MKELHVKVRKRSMMLFALLLLATVVFAVPAKPGLKRLLTLTDGTTVTATLVGDEFAHYWVDGDGNTYQAAGGDVYQLVDVQTVKQRAAKRRAASNQRRMRRLAPRKVGDVGSISGSKKGLIILVNFSDVKFKTGNDNALYKRIANEENLSYGDFKGSMYDYFKAQSEGKFELTFDVVGPVNISKGQSYYGSNDKNDNDEHPAEMVIEALKKADADVDFSDYDWDDDKEVEQVYIVYAGKGEADGGEDFTIWPHEWQLSAAAYYGDGAGAQTLDGVKIDTYACGGELNGVTGSIAGIGTMCHEFSHCLGYPDFYDTDYSGGQGMFQWDLMDSGSYNDDGYQPSGYTSYERWVAGWKEPIELEYTQSISNMAALQDEDSKSYIIYNKGNKNEYYLLENRQKKCWDASLPGKGLLILHVDYNKTAWEDNQPNDNPSHQRMTWIPADNEYQYTTYNGTKYYTEAGAANDPYPYGSINAFGKTTTPAAKLFNKNSDGTYYLDSSIENITQNSDGTISFDFKGKNITPTIIAEPEALTFKTAPGTPQAKTFELLSELLTEDITVTLTDANGVFSIDKTSVTTAESEEGASVTVTFSPATEGSYTGTVTLSSEGAENVVISLTATARESASNPDTKNFKLVTSVDDLEEGMRYIIACGSKETAAGALESSLLESESVTMSKDIITIGDNVTVFELEGNQTDGWTFKNESTNKYLYSTATKSLAYSNDAKTWTLSNGTAGVIMAYGTLGTMLYNSSNPRFTTYTSSPTASMIQANLYMETSEIVKKDVTMVFDPATAEATLGEEFTEPTLSTTPEGLTLSYSSSTPTVATVNESTGKVTLVAAGTTTITATFAGDETYNGRSASYTLTVSEASGGDDPTPSGNEFALVTSASDFEEGDYIIVYDGAAMNTTVTSNRLQYTAVTPSNNVITTDNAAIIWHIAPNGDYYTIYNARESKYAASNGTKNQAQLLASGTDDKSLWSVTAGSTFEFVNKYNAAKSVNANLRRNGDYGFACYATGTGGALSLYKRTSGSSGGGGDDPDPDDPDPDDPTTDEDYYQPADGKKGEALKTAMCGIIYNRTEKDYDDLWEAYYTTDVDSDGKIWDMYSNKTKYTPVLKGSTYSQEGDCYNREHAFPQSWFGGGMPAKSDLHHVYPTDGYVNGMRSNNPYGETTGDKYKSANDFSKLGACTYPGYSGKVFEPNDEYKGDFARTYFYMVTCYEEQLLTWYTNNSNDTEVDEVLDGTTYPALQTWQLNMLMEWAKNDPVSEKEINRNNAVYAIQKNRNPFIDYPGLEEYIWGSMTTTAFSYDNYVQPVYKQNVTMAFSAATATATLDEKFTEPTLTTDPEDLTVTYSSSEPTVATVDENTGEVTLVAVGTTVITATFAGDETYNAKSASYTLTVSDTSTPEPVVSTGKYEKVTDASTLKADDKILIAYVNEDTKYVLSTTQNTNNRAATTIEVNDDGTLSPDENAQVITLEKDGDNFLFNVGEGYLYAASTSGNQLKTETTADDNAKATIEIASGGDATIVFQGKNTRNNLRYNSNNGSPIFSCYASSSTMLLPQIYREVTATPTPVLLLGDANGDGKVNITDAVMIVDYILGNEPEDFNKAAANVSGDVDDEGQPIITITDAVGVVDIILNQVAQ